MIRDRIVSETDLRDYLPGRTLAGELQALLLQQQATWQLVRIGYKSLESVRVKSFDFNLIQWRVQFNPGRLKSTTAKVDDSSIRSRPCFLCHDNLPPDQRGILYREEFIMLVNPYPIFPEHFTIAHVDHRPQRILSTVDSFLGLAADLSPEYLVLYNGPRCGASAPDHMHFQAGTRSFLPLVEDYLNVCARFGRLLVDNGEVKIISVDRYLPSFLALESASSKAMAAAFEAIYRVYQSVGGSNDEPMLNLLCWVDEGIWRLVLILRSKHRPDRYSARPPARILMSPAAIDLAGVGVIPVEDDFDRVDSETLKEIIEEVTLPGDLFRDITGAIAEAMSG